MVFLTSSYQSGQQLHGWVPMAVTLSVYLGMHLYASMQAKVSFGMHRICFGMQQIEKNIYLEPNHTDTSNLTLFIVKSHEKKTFF